MNDPMVCYSTTDPRTRFQKIRDKLFPSKHCFAPEAPEEFKDCIHGQATTHLSFVDRLRVLLTGVVVTQWRTVTEHKVGRTINAATCHIGTAKDLAMILLAVLFFSATCYCQYPLETRLSSYKRYDEPYRVYISPHSLNPPRIYSRSGTYLGELSTNRYAPDSVSNPYGRYGSRYSPDSIKTRILVTVDSQLVASFFIQGEHQLKVGSMFVVWAYLFIWYWDAWGGCTIVETVLRHMVPKYIRHRRVSRRLRPQQKASTYG